MNTELTKAIELGKTLALYCFFNTFLEDRTEDYTANKNSFYTAARDFVTGHPDTELAHALVYRGRLWRLNYGALNFDRDMPVSWAYSDWMFQEYEGMDGLTKLITDTKDDFGINVEGLVKYLQEHGLNIRDIGYWTGVNPERYFEEHPDVDSISTSWDAEAEVLFPLIKNNYCIL